MIYSELLEYDFFKICSHHLNLYSPNDIYFSYENKHNLKLPLPKLRQNTYSDEVIVSIIDLLGSKKKSQFEIINEYGIPETTLNKWIQFKKEFEKTD